VSRKLKKLGLVALLVVLMLIVTPTIVKADPWSALEGSGYAVTVEGFPLEEVYPGDVIRAYAGTTYPEEEVEYVVFLWLAPDETVISDPHDSHDLSGFGPDPIGMYTDFDVRVASCEITVGTDIPFIVGDWGVQAEFWGPDGKLKGTGSSTGIVKIRATSFYAVPEVPMIGTLTILLTMLASLAIFARKRKIF